MYIMKQYHSCTSCSYSLLRDKEKPLTKDSTFQFLGMVKHQMQLERRCFFKASVRSF